MPLTPRQIDQRILNAIRWGVSPVEICTRYQLSWQRVHQVITGAVVLPTPGPTMPVPPGPAAETAAAPEPTAAITTTPTSIPTPAVAPTLDEDIAFLATRGVEIVRVGGEWWWRDRTLTADDIHRMAARKRALIAAAGSAP